MRIQSARPFALCVVTGILTSLPSLASAQEDVPKLETLTQKASYHIGTQIGANLKRQGLEIDVKLLAAGLAAAIEGKESLLSEAEATEVMNQLQQLMQQKMAQKGKLNLATGQKFLEENKAKEGVKVTTSGLQFVVINEGDGATPTKKSTVEAHYRGTLIDGTVVDSSYEGEAPIAGEAPRSFPVSGVIAGWTEALQLMKAGGKYRLFIPSELAYGPSGRPGIEPNSVLIFDIELVSVTE